MLPALNTALVSGVALCGIAVLTPSAVAERTSAPCFVAGDALGVELHCAAVLAMANPRYGPMELDAFPVELAAVSNPRPWPTNVRYSPVDSPAIEIASAWTILSDLTAWLTVPPPSFGGDVVWMAIVN